MQINDSTAVGCWHLNSVFQCSTHSHCLIDVTYLEQEVLRQTPRQEANFRLQPADKCCHPKASQRYKSIMNAFFLPHKVADFCERVE